MCSSTPVHVAPFKVPFSQTVLVGDSWCVPEATGQALMLHGGGQSSRQRFSALRQQLAAGGIDSVAFDFIGHGETGGHLLGSSLAERVAQALAVITFMSLDDPRLTVIGSSMGAYVATRIAAQRQIRAMGLLVPGVYATAAFDLPFGPAFSAVIREPLSWRKSDAFDTMQRFDGDLLVVSAQNDQVVPAEIPERLYHDAVRASARSHHVVPGARHDLNAHYAESPESRAPVFAKLLALCGGRPHD